MGRHRFTLSLLFTWIGLTACAWVAVAQTLTRFPPPPSIPASALGPPVTTNPAPAPSGERYPLPYLPPAYPRVDAPMQPSVGLPAPPLPPTDRYPLDPRSAAMKGFTPPGTPAPWPTANPSPYGPSHLLPPLPGQSPPGQPAYGPATPFPSPYAPSAPAFPPSTIAPVSAAPQTAQEFEASQCLAIVGDQHIFAGDILPQVDQALEPYREKAPAAVLKEQRRLLTKQLLNQAVETKILYIAFLRSIPADKQEEALKTVRKKVFEEFDRDQLAKAMEKAQVNSPAELDLKLRRYGSSLYKQRMAYLESKLSRASIGQKVKIDPEITFEEMLRHYQQHGTEFEFPARARWHQLTVLFEKFPSKEAAQQTIVQMYNEVYLGGTPMEAVARRSSQESKAAEGGFHDWTTKGSLASDEIDRAVFSLPLSRLSPVIEDSRGLHIIRVLERQEAGRTPFEEAQVGIKETIRKEKVKQAITDYVEKAKKDIPVWTVFDAEKTSSTRTTPPR